MYRLASTLPAELFSGFENLGAFTASAEAYELARLANSNRPRLLQNDQFGREKQTVEMHPAYHALVRRARYAGVASSLWDHHAKEDGVRYQARALRLFLLAGLENGHLSEITTTSAGIAALMSENELYNVWQSTLLSRQHDASDKPIDKKKSAALAFAFQDEDGVAFDGQTGCMAHFLAADSNVAHNQYEISGSKIRVANPNADAFLVTAQHDAGRHEGKLSCFLVPKFHLNGERNNITIEYLTQEAAYRSRPMAKMTFYKSSAWLIAKASEGEKVVNGIEMMTRFDGAVVAAGTLRAALQFAIDLLRSEQTVEISPLKMRVFADMALDIAAAESFVMRLARAFDQAKQDRSQAAFARIMMPVAAFWVQGLVAPIVSSIIAQLGVKAFAHNAFLPRLLNDSCIGTFNENNAERLVYDVVRSVEKAPGLFQEIVAILGQDIGVAAGAKTVEVLQAANKIAVNDISAGCIFVEQLSYAAAAAALKEYETDAVATAFIESRLGGQWRSTYGMLNIRYDAQHILETLYPLG